jgi:hypothetical protein
MSVDYEVNWTGNRDESIPGPPFSVLYLCEMQNEVGLGAGNRTELFHMIAESLFLDFLPGPFSTQKRSRMSDLFAYMAGAKDDVISLTTPSSSAGRDGASVSSLPQRETSLHQSFSRRYATLGMSKIEVPVESIREACATRLAAEIVRYVRRSPQDKDPVGALKGTTDGRFDLEGLARRFGKEWTELVEAKFAKSFPGELPVDVEGSPEALQAFLAALPERLRVFETEMVASDGFDPHAWGQVTTLVRNSTGPAVEALLMDLRSWLSDVLEKPERGLGMARGPNGLLELLGHRFRTIYKEAPIESAKRAEECEANAAAWKQRRDALTTEIANASRNTWIKLLGLRGWTVRKLYTDLGQAALELVRERGAAFVATECGTLRRPGKNTYGNSALVSKRSPPT